MNNLLASLLIGLMIVGSTTQHGLAGSPDWQEFDPAPMTLIYPEQSSLSNPPFFHWQPMEGAASYRIVFQGEGQTHTWNTSRNFFTPADKVAPGSYTLKLAALDADGHVMRQLRRDDVTVPETAAGIAVDMNHPTKKSDRIGFTREMVEAIRNADQPPLSEYRERMLAMAQQPRHEVLQKIAEPKAYENGVWDHETWKKNNSLCFVIESYVISQSLAYELTGDPTYLNNAREIMLVASSWDPAGTTGVWENDHSAQALLHGLSIGYDTLRDELTPEERAKIAQAIRGRSEDMYRFLNPFVPKPTSAGTMNDPDNNHPWFCASALGFGGLALLDEVPEAQAWTAYTAQLFNGVFLSRGGRFGGWHEGIDYWSYTLFFVFQVADALDLGTGIDLYQHPWLQNTGFFKVYTHPPVGGHVPFGDCHHHDASGFDKLVMARLASRMNDPLLWRYVDSIDEKIHDSRLIYAVAWDQRGEDEKPVPAIPNVQFFEDIGWVVANSDVFNAEKQAIFALRCGRSFGRGAAHSHADLNHFILTAGGDQLLWDAGYYDGYLTPHHRDYARHSKAHNTILIDGQGQSLEVPDLQGRITRYEVKDGVLTVEGDASDPRVYGGRVDRFRRLFQYEPNERLIVQDDIQLPKPGQVSWLLHSAYPIQWDAQTQSLLIQSDHYELRGKLESSTPVEAAIEDKFPLDPDGKGKRDYAQQYHLELKTVNPVKDWQPRFTFELHPLTKGE